MMSSMAEVVPLPHVSFHDYLAAEQVSDIAHEWLEGVVFAMGATTLEQSRLAGNMHTALNNTLRGHGRARMSRCSASVQRPAPCSTRTGGFPRKRS